MLPSCPGIEVIRSNSPLQRKRYSPVSLALSVARKVLRKGQETRAADEAWMVAAPRAAQAQLTKNCGMALLLVENRSERHWLSVRVRAFHRQGQRFPVRQNREPAMSVIFSVRLFCIIGKRIGVYLLE